MVFWQSTKARTAESRFSALSNNRFFVFEGIDGSGKTTRSKAFAKTIGAFWTSEPYDRSTQDFVADRERHIEEVIAPALRVGPVVCDRYYLSTWAYQGVMHPPSLLPDVIYWLDVDVDVCLSRVRSRGELDRREDLVRYRDRYRAVSYLMVKL